MSSSSNHSTLLALGLILTVTLVAAVAWGTSLLSDVDALAMSATPTPTKTPGVHSAGQALKNSISLSQAPLPTFTPVLAPTARPTPTATPTTSIVTINDTQLSEKLSSIARSYRLNPAGDFIIVDQDAQQMIIVEKGKPKRILSVTTGDPEQGWDTPAWFGLVGDYWGTFQGPGGVRADDGWWLFQRGGNFLIHGLPYTVDDSGRKHYAGRDDLGTAPASHGCIRLDPADAHWLTQWNPKGKAIIILPLTNKAKNQP